MEKRGAMHPWGTIRLTVRLKYPIHDKTCIMWSLLLAGNFAIVREFDYF